MAKVLIVWRDMTHYPQKWGAPDQDDSGSVEGDTDSV
jgi:hypothetical protein